MSNFQPEVTPAAETESSLFRRVSPTPAPDAPEDAANGGAVRNDPLLTRVSSIEEMVRDLRTMAETRTRESLHQQFSPYILVAGGATAIAALLLIWAGAEFWFGATYSVVLMKLAFAMVLQLIGLSAIVAGNYGREG